VSSATEPVLLAVNGTLMRGLELNPNLLAVGGSFVQENATASCYRLWSIHDRHPGMLRVAQGGAAIELEVWSIPRPGLAAVLLGEPAGLCIGKVQLCDHTEVLGVLAEPWLCEGCREITPYGGWRRYITSASRE
jgi:hypothetical protein